MFEMETKPFFYNFLSSTPLFLVLFFPHSELYGVKQLWWLHRRHRYTGIHFSTLSIVSIGYKKQTKILICVNTTRFYRKQHDVYFLFRPFF